MNYYYYEVFIAVFNILGRINYIQESEKEINMLMFLKNYQRVNKPSDLEAENWYSAFPDTQSLDALSEFRLPFTKLLFTPEIWDVIRPEVNLKTYRLWFGAIHIVKELLNEDDICTYVVKDIVSFL